mgnify:CR=1 FL=1
MIKKQFNKKNLAVLIATLIMVVFAALVFAPVNAATDTTRPTILSVSPANNERDLTRTEQITVVFSEDMLPSSINANTFIVSQRPTPEFGGYNSLEILGIVTYNGRTATFTPNEMLSPNQRYGNVFTVTITNGAKDLAGNSISQNYMWSFTTGNDAFNTGASTSQLGQSSATSRPAVVVVPPTQQVVTAPVTSTQTTQTTENNFPWFWVIAGAALLLLLLLLIFAPAMKPSRKKTVAK